MKWEYRRVTFQYDSKAKQMMITQDGKSYQEVDFLQMMGDEGWELVTTAAFHPVTRNQYDPYAWLYFKRQKP